MVLARTEDHVSTFTTVTTDTLAPVLLDSLELSARQVSSVLSRLS